MSAGGCQVVRAPGKGGREPQQPTAGAGDDLDVHPVAAVLVGVVGPTVADPVALGKGAVEQDEVGFVLAKRLQRARRMLGEQVNDRGGVGVSRGLADPEPDGDPRESDVFA